MDKQQREFIITYFRKRNMVANPYPRKREKYETLYMVRHPEMFDLDNINLATVSWLDDLIKHPEKLEQYNFKKNDQRFGIWLVPEIIKYFPQLFRFLNLDQVRDGDLADMIINNPELIDDVSSEKLDSFSPSYISHIVSTNPDRFIKYFDISKVTDKSGIREIITKAPYLTNRFNLSGFTDWDIYFIAAENPDILMNPDIVEREDYKKVLSHIVYNEDALLLILKRPEILRQVLQHVEISSYLIGSLVTKHPEAIKIIGEDRFKSSTIVDLLRRDSSLVRHFNTRRIKPSDYANLLMTNPELYKIRSLSDLHMYNVKELLKKHPELIKPLLDAKGKPDWDEFTYLTLDDLREIINAQPSLGQYLKKYVNKQRFMHEQIGK